MKKIILCLIIAMSIMACEKNSDSLFEGSQWIKTSYSGTTELLFNTDSYFKITITQASNSQIISTERGSYSEDKGSALLKFDKPHLSDHEATISGSSLILINLSTNSSYKYSRK